MSVCKVLENPLNISIGDKMHKRITLLLLLCGFSVNSKEFPEYIKNARCHIDKDFEKCMKANGNKIIRQVAEGIPELNLPSMNPLKLSFVQMINTQQLQVNISNIEVHGLSDMKIFDVKAEPLKGMFQVFLTDENVTICGQYRAHGRVLVLPVDGDGNFSMYLKNGVYNETVLSRIVKRNGDDYLKRIDTLLQAHFEKVEFNFQNLFGDNKQLGDQVNTFLNENWEILLNDYGPGIERMLRNYLGKHYDSLVDQVPMKDFFLID
ncbi:hypothetical protein HHI36_006657 [Cryptolaemus montrouzieri]|uniref:Protein takeout n=1 Tax=Cryptolaemus montrouzieri TaxID=559131 RepID=A0ABD2NY30_9CUCU